MRGRGSAGGRRGPLLKGDLFSPIPLLWRLSPPSVLLKIRKSEYFQKKTCNEDTGGVALSKQKEFGYGEEEKES